MHDVMIKPNSKPILLKRFIADGFDIVCLFMLFMLLNYVVSNSYLATTYRKHMENCSLIEKYTVANYEKEDGSKVFKLDVVAEKVTFLSSRSKDTPERE